LIPQNNSVDMLGKKAYIQLSLIEHKSIAAELIMTCM
jgi:hypothetical protein